MSDTRPSIFDHPFGTRIDRETLSQRLNAVSGWEAKSRLLVQLARELPALPESDKISSNRVSGCESTVWLITRWHGDQLLVAADSDSRVIKGLLALLLTAYHAQTPATITSFKLEIWLAELGLSRFLSASRGNGLRAIAQRILSAVEEHTGTRNG